MIKQKLLFLFVALVATTTLWASNVITYSATEKLPTTTTNDRGLHIFAFNVPISSHSFSKGQGTITFSGELTSIGNDAFYGCSGLTSVTIPNSVIEIWNNAFRNCSSLASVTFAKNSQLTMIGKWAFYECISLTSITIPDSVKTIGESAFESCSKLGSIDIPNSVTTIGDWAFMSCKNLSIVTLGNSIRSIGTLAFDDCALTKLICYALTPPVCGNYCFSNNTAYILVYVHAHSVATYKKANIWNGFKNLQGFPDEYANITCIAENGSISGDGQQIIGDSCILEVTPNYGYHFTQWSDGNTNNPRTIIITRDTILIAEFAPNDYTISSNAENGQVIGIGQYKYLDTCSITAVANEHYHFVRWSDGNTNNPRTITVKGNATYSAIFAIDQHIVSIISTHGIVSGVGTHDYGSNISLMVNPMYGYHFTQWSDGNTDNPRSIVLTQDTSFIVEYAMNKQGRCGANLYWQYNNGTLTITGLGSMYNFTYNTMPWVLLRDSITKVIFPNDITSIGNYAFYGLTNKDFKTLNLSNSVETIGKYVFAECSYLKTITLGAKLEDIDEYAFQNDQRLLYVNCYAEEPPVLQENAFDNYDIYLQVLCEVLDEYKVAKGWKLFDTENVSCLSAEEKPIAGDQVIVTPSTDNATFTWPANPSADGYSLEITKDGVVFCTLKFNAQGQLTGIAFAPSRGAAREMASAEMTASGWQFTVTGLSQASKYGYTLDALNASQQSIKHYQGEFTTTGTTGLERLTIDDAQCTIRKMIIDNQLFIFRGDKMYNAAGVLMK